MFTTLLQVALGGAIGASLRYLTGISAVRVLGHGFPYGTLTVNIVGSFVMGMLSVLLMMHAPKYAPFWMTGLLGGYTTFSAFSLDTLALYERGEVTAAAGYVLVSVIGGVLALFAGLLLARSLTT